MGSRYIVFVGPTQFYLRDSLAGALDAKAEFGGTVYEPLAMSAAERVFNESDAVAACRAVVAYDDFSDGEDLDRLYENMVAWARKALAGPLPLTPEQAKVFDSAADRDRFVRWFDWAVKDGVTNWDAERYNIATGGEK